MNKKQAVILVSSAVCILAAVMIAGCSSRSTDVSTAAASQTAAGYKVVFFLNGQQVASLGLEQLQTLPKVSLALADRSEEGPTLLSVLELAGIKEFSKLTVVGMVRGRVATAELELQRSQVTEDLILDFTNRGTTKLAGAQLSEDKWVIDVAEIRAE